MLRYVLRRFLTAIPTLFVIVTISFFLMRVAPGGPFNQEKGLNPVIKANLERVFHLDQPLWKQYLLYLNNLIHGDFGPSYNLPDFTVAELFADGLPISVQLGGSALVLALLLGGMLGMKDVMPTKLTGAMDFQFAARGKLPDPLRIRPRRGTDEDAARLVVALDLRRGAAALMALVAR